MSLQAVDMQLREEIETLTLDNSEWEPLGSLTRMPLVKSSRYVYQSNHTRVSFDGG